MIKKVYKYGTGQEVPEGAQYLSTIIEPRWTERDIEKDGIDGHVKIQENLFVWHYFLVDVSTKNNE